MTLLITRLDLTADDRRCVAQSSRDVVQGHRCLVIASVLDGGTCTAAAASAGMPRPTLRAWVHWYNLKRIVGLLDRPRPMRLGLRISASSRPA
ncbi:helix-turn-helix domain-containing protein [Methylobacterium sp. E-016]|uniref:helix-turn-helix domain-containing protein n=1 Tax=Methylobacterium sp. E-016 TaxID=2836556 RepID=UPI00391A4B1E